MVYGTIWKAQVIIRLKSLIKEIESSANAEVFQQKTCLGCADDEKEDPTDNCAMCSRFYFDRWHKEDNNE